MKRLLRWMLIPGILTMPFLLDGCGDSSRKPAEELPIWHAEPRFSYDISHLEIEGPLRRHYAHEGLNRILKVMELVAAGYPNLEGAFWLELEYNPTGLITSVSKAEPSDSVRHSPELGNPRLEGRQDSFFHDLELEVLDMHQFRFKKVKNRGGALRVFCIVEPASYLPDGQPIEGNDPVVHWDTLDYGPKVDQVEPRREP